MHGLIRYGDGSIWRPGSCSRMFMWRLHDMRKACQGACLPGKISHNFPL